MNKCILNGLWELKKMTMTDREKFIQHYVTLSTIRIIMSKLKKKEQPTEESLKKDVDVILKTRCRKLDQEAVTLLLDDLIQEAMLGGYVINDLLED